MATFKIHEDFSTSPTTEHVQATVIANAKKDSKIASRSHVVTVTGKGGENIKKQRQTFAVLNNFAHGRPHAHNHQYQHQQTFIRGKEPNYKAPAKSTTTTGKVNDENEIPEYLMQKVATAATATNITSTASTTNAAMKKPGVGRGVSVPVDQFKAFCVDENVIGSSEYDENTSANTTITMDEVEKYHPNCSSTSDIREPLQELRNELLQTPGSIDVLSPMSVDKSMEKLNTSSTLLNTKNDREVFFLIEEYQLNIMENLLETEVKHLPKYGYMRKQPDIDHSMRTILIDWLVEVCEEYRLQTETLCLAVSYIDRFLSIMSVVRAKLQLVGTAAMFIASKYEEIYPPDVSEFVYITDNTYTKQHVLLMERFILKALKFDLCVPTTYTFINLYAAMTKLPDEIKYLAIYIAELSLLEAEPFLQYLPSKISAAAILLASYNLNKDTPVSSMNLWWCLKIQQIFGYTMDDLKEILLNLNQTHMAAVDSSLEAMREKYKSNKYLEVSKLKPKQLNEEQINVAIEKLQTQPAATVSEEDNAAPTSSSARNNDNNENVRKKISSLTFV